MHPAGVHTGPLLAFYAVVGPGILLDFIGTQRAVKRGIGGIIPFLIFSILKALTRPRRKSPYPPGVGRKSDASLPMQGPLIAFYHW